MQTYYTPHSMEASDDASSALGAIATEFSKNVEEASGKLVAAAGQFTAISDGFNTAIAEVQAAADRAEEARKATEAIQAKLERDYGALNGLMRELQERISALAVLAKPLSTAAPSAPVEAPAPVSAVEATETAPEAAPDITQMRARWQGWQG